MRFFASFPLFLLLLAGQPVHAATASWRLEDREAWVQEAPSIAAGRPLHDRQIRIMADGDDRYEHLIVRLTAAQVGGHAPPVSIDLDPRFQQLVIHSLRLTHGNDAARSFTAAQLQEQLRTQAAEAEPQKRELNPRLQLSLEAAGAQPGDLLECEYTVHTRTSRYAGLFPGHYAAQWSAGEDPSVSWEHLHVSWPPARPMQFRVSAGTGAAPQVHTQTGELDIQWPHAPVFSPETDIPRWFDRQSLLQLSDFGTWSRVAALLTPQYAGVEPHALPTAPSVGATPAMILNALQLLQTKVHALNGIGSGPYLPADPALVLQRGFGDSRDLARLLTSLLRRLGIDAQVALADSRRGAVLESALPSPFILDSGLVLVHAGNSHYWINPAATGPLAVPENADPADLRHALMVVSGGGIVALPQPALDSRLRSVTQQFDLRAADTRPAALTVITQYHGTWAQAVRADLFAQSPAQLQLSQIQGVVADYPTVTPVGEVRLQDLPQGQGLQLTARFRIPQAFGNTPERHFDLFAEALAGAVQTGDEATRRFPLSLPWPLKLEQHIEVLLPPDFQVAPGKIQIDTAAFRYQREVRFRQGMLQVTHSYVALSDHVDPADYPAFLKANARVYEALGLRLRPQGSWWERAAQRLEYHFLMIVAVTVVVATLAFSVWRRLRGR